MCHNLSTYLLRVRVARRPVQPRRHAVLAPQHQAAALLLHRVRMGPRDPARRGDGGGLALKPVRVPLPLLPLLLLPRHVIGRARASARVVGPSRTRSAMIGARAVAPTSGRRRGCYCCRRRSRRGRGQERVMQEARPSPLGRVGVAHSRAWSRARSRASKKKEGEGSEGAHTHAVSLAWPLRAAPRVSTGSQPLLLPSVLPSRC